METRTNEIKADSLPFAVLLALFTLFLLTRPPILLLFNPEPIGSLTPSDPWPAPIPTVRAPVRPPPLQPVANGNRPDARTLDRPAPGQPRDGRDRGRHSDQHQLGARQDLRRRRYAAADSPGRR